MSDINKLAEELLVEAGVALSCELTLDDQGNAIVVCPDVTMQARVLEAIGEHEVRVRTRDPVKEE